MLKTYYHWSNQNNLTILIPQQPQIGEPFTLFVAVSLFDALVWRKKLYTKGNVEPKYLYTVRIDAEKTIVWTEERRGIKKRYKTGEKNGGLVWIQEIIPCEQVTIEELLAKTRDR